jgi:hypothetical protein
MYPLFSSEPTICGSKEEEKAMPNPKPITSCDETNPENEPISPDLESQTADFKDQEPELQSFITFLQDDSFQHREEDK